MEVAKFSFLIGPQASGKSTIAKLIYYFQSIFMLNRKAEMQIPIKDFSDLQKFLEKKFYSVFPNLAVSENFRITYQYSQDMLITIEKHKYVEISISEKLKPVLENAYLDEGYAFPIETIEQLNIDRHLLYIPASRSLMGMLSNLRYEINIDEIIKPFLSTISFLQTIFTRPLENIIAEKEHYKLSTETFHKDEITKIHELSKSVIKGEFRYEQSIGKLYYNNNESVPLNQASSGQQEAVWIIQIIMLCILNDWKCTLIIEEPEAHIYPESQMYLMQLISIFQNIEGNNVIITTHSPYILTSADNMIYADITSSIDASRVAKIIPKECWISPDNTCSYRLQNGGAEDIKDSELLQIKAELIDEVSTIISRQYDELMDIECGK